MLPAPLVAAVSVATVVRSGLTAPIPPVVAEAFRSLATTSAPAASAVMPELVAVRITLPDVERAPALKLIVPLEMLALPLPMPTVPTLKSTVSAGLAVTVKLALKAASREERLIVSAPAVGVVLIVSDAVGLAKVMLSPSVESRVDMPSAPPVSVSVAVSAAPLNVKMRSVATMVSSTGSRPV